LLATLVRAARDFAAFNKPPLHDYFSVQSYFDGLAPICETEVYIDRKENIITLKPGREETWLDVKLWAGLRKFSSRFTRVLPPSQASSLVAILTASSLSSDHEYAFLMRFVKFS